MARPILRRTTQTIVTENLSQIRLNIRVVHPWAWWIWAIGAAVAVSLSFNPFLTILIAFSTIVVVLLRRTDAPWAQAVWIYFSIAGIIILVRMIFHICFSGTMYGTVLFQLPQINLPDWMAGIRIGGPVTLEGLLYTLYDTLRLGAMLICLGAANALANPKKAIRNTPPALHQITTSLVIALSVAPQLIESVQRIRKARRLRGGVGKGVKGAISILIPVLEDAIQRSLSLAAGMESRGYGRTRDESRVSKLFFWLLVAGMMCIIFATFSLLAIPESFWWTIGAFSAGMILIFVGLKISGRRVKVTHYRPDPWGIWEWMVALCGLASAGISIWQNQVSHLSWQVPTSPPFMPPLTIWMIVVAVLLVAPGIFTPEPSQVSYARYVHQSAISVPPNFAPAMPKKQNFNYEGSLT